MHIKQLHLKELRNRILMHYSCVDIILINTDLYMSALCTYCFKKTSFSSSCVVCVCVCFLSILFLIRCDPQILHNIVYITCAVVLH